MFIEQINKYRREIMGFSAVWILFFHEWVHIFDNVLFINHIERFLVRIGFCGVDIFFFISGMGLVSAIEKYTLKTFWIRRYKRLIIPFIAIVLIRGYFEAWNTIHFIKVASGYALFFKDTESILWFATAIAIFYFVFPLYYKVFIKTSNKIIFTIIFIEVWCLISVLVSEYINTDIYGVTNRISVFALGVLFGWIGKNGDIEISKQKIGLLCMTGFLGVFLSYMTNYRKLYLLVPVSNCCIPNCLMSLSICFLLPFLFKHCALKKYICAVLGFLGMISYELYCIQELPRQAMFWLTYGKISNVISNMLYFSMIVLLGFILFCINNLFINRKERENAGSRRT